MKKSKYENREVVGIDGDIFKIMDSIANAIFGEIAYGADFEPYERRVFSNKK